MMFSPPIEHLITEFARLPGIGRRTAQRLTFYMLRSSDEDALQLAHAISEVKAKIGFCEVCFNLADAPRCRICSDERRNSHLICVVEEAQDMIPIEQTHEYQGLYHVLGGALSPIDGIDPEDLRISELLDRVKNGGVEEVVLATNPNTIGEATALYLAEEIRAIDKSVTVTKLASGLPMGADIEYADEVTVGRALAGRRAV